ncbi:HK97 gp10 family phage protein [Paenibacillus lautus]|uniref:HK97 gp10 family phage protein n=1 Tax=Paenibacillus lautus TaxID=1401 RepID=UPI003D278365
MARRGSFDYSQFKRMALNAKRALDSGVIDKFAEEFLLEMAYRGLRKIKKRTPVGENTVSPGNLRRNWKVGSVVKQGHSYEIEIYNDTAYAMYVEYGHRTGKDLTKWVEGKFMMTISINELEKEWPKYLEKKQLELLNQIFN